MLNMFLYFIAGGVITTAIVLLEESGHRLLSGFATLMPVFTLIAYFFVGESRGGKALGQHAQLVLAGTLAAWVPSMVTIIVLASRVSTYRAIGAGLIVFFICATVFLLASQYFRWFR